ncbi:ShlB/FhaC/HecB family hemolysin secretion/activation protein [Mesorhizobium sp.]|uniref:ShlB/FhaC/HecB family hemolysin secretion/activation protein n=1 Tax=Mesorhizobium sp. TaxID=1871066 RepID=UPI000FE51B76|nr:ShlB/FhaC/HecB family hemolysin secretion/activation protein [Mesorhizobium sp.]RWQ58826.1 MAG: ShlB/FhaC/HecB family hemolysin secretion/activation protein [Mesorhizobium sp.]
MPAFALSCGSAFFLSLDASYAQTVPPGAEPGRIEQRFEEPPAPQARVRIPEGLESTMPAAEAAQVTLELRGVEIEGSTVYTDDQLRELYAELLGKKVTLLQVFEVAAKITARYGNDGYLLSRVIVPPQELNQAGAVIRLQAVEGYIDEVIWPDGVERYRNFFDDYAAKITAERPARADRLERYLLLANDLPGLTFKSTLRASERNPGASTLVLEMEIDPYDVSLSTDNYGTEASGPYQGMVSGHLNNAFGAHERLSGGYVIAGPSEDDDPELHYFFWGYDQVLNSEGLTFSFSGNASRGDPGTALLSALEYQTQSLNLTTGVSYPFIRTRSQNLTGGFFFDYEDSEGLTSSGLSTEDRLRILRAELAYDFADGWSGINQAIIALSQGIDGLGSTSNDNPNASRIPGAVDFFKTTLFLSRQQPLPNRFTSYMSVFGQLAADPLLSSQECGYGGRRFGRGFDASIVTGDHCLLLNGELRYDLDVPVSLDAFLDRAQAYVFTDYGRIWNIDAPAGTPDSDDGASAGLGVRFETDTLSADIAVSRTLEDPESVVDPSDWRGWFKVSATF